MSKQNNNFENQNTEVKEELAEEKLSYICEADNNSATYKKYKKTHKKHEKHLTRKQKIKKRIIIAVSVLLSLVLLFVGSFFVINQIGKNKLLNYKDVKVDAIDGANTYDDGKTIEYNGKQYVLNENVMSVLCMGVDKEIVETENYGRNGQSDAIFVLTIDVSNGKINIIPINRDTMVDINTYSESGKYAGVEKKQICLAYAYGDGGIKSCENVATSVSRLFYGIPVKSYIALDLDAVDAINELCGGITVVPNETIRGYGADLTKGVSTKLTDKQAQVYVRYRDQDKNDSNIKRMERQKTFLTTAFAEMASNVKSDISSVSKIYKRLSPYSYTNVGLPQVTFLATKILSINKNLDIEYKSIDGKITKNKYMEFTPDETKLFELILDVYYNEK